MTTSIQVLQGLD
jgi:hypothetical protein